MKIVKHEIMMHIEEPVNPKILSKSFFMRNNAELIARELLGKLLVTNINGEGLTGGIIAETEAYLGIEDRASHAYGGHRSKRNEALYMEGGTAYVHMCYGIHTMLNIATNAEGIPHGILIRGMEPVFGIEIMKKRRGMPAATGDDDNFIAKRLASGPGNLTKALGIEMRHNKTKICADDDCNSAGLSVLPNAGSEIFIADAGINMNINESVIIISPRIGIGYAGEWAQKPLRFCLGI